MKINALFFFATCFIICSCKSNKISIKNIELEISQLNQPSVKSNFDSIKISEKGNDILFASELKVVNKNIPKPFQLSTDKIIKLEKVNESKPTVLFKVKNTTLKTNLESSPPNTLKKINKLSVISFSLALLSLAFAIVFPANVIPLIGIIISGGLALLSIYQINKSKGKQRGILITITSIIMVLATAVLIIIASLQLN